MAEWTDERLLQAVQRNEPDAYEAFVDRYGRRLFAFGLRMCGHREDAEDVFQETLMKAYLGLKDLREPRAVRTWLFRVASNQCLMKRRTGKYDPTEEISLDQLKPAGWEDGILPEVSDWSRLPEDEAGRLELRDALERALADLPPTYKIIAILRDVEGLTTEETAEALGLRPPAVKMRLHRARLALRESLAEHHGGTRAPRRPEEETTS
jgi:RNA polymerase sigma-70 factor (ECF subfamily)